MFTGVRFITFIIAFSAAIGPSAAAHAWGKTGHRVTGAIADAYLSDAARREVAAILGTEDLAEASTWPDFMRASPDEFWQDTASPYHYVTIPAGKTYAEVGAPPEGNAITALARFRAVLEDDGAGREEKQLALRFIVHLIGDLHQPLHTGNGTDRGGNDYAVTFYSEHTNLHRVWDSLLVEHEQLSYSELSGWLMRRLTRERVASWQQTDPVVWATESAAIRDTIYPGGDREIRSAYIFEHRETVRIRLLQAGVRMAAYLNAVFAEPNLGTAPAD
ncbi:MAG: S1/P1 nuclease [Pseudomonadota bacterium]